MDPASKPKEESNVEPELINTMARIVNAAWWWSTGKIDATELRHLVEALSEEELDAITLIAQHVQRSERVKIGYVNGE